MLCLYILIIFSRHADEKSNARGPVHSNALTKYDLTLIIDLDYKAIYAEGFQRRRRATLKFLLH